MKKKKPPIIRPDEVLSFGPLSAIRFGKNTVFKWNRTEDEFKEMQKRIIAEYPVVIAEIDGLVTEIELLIHELNPEELLHRAYWEMFGNNTDEDPKGDPIFFRMIDYVQSLIAAIPVNSNKRQDITEEEWGNLRGKIDTLFFKLNTLHATCLTAVTMQSDPNLSIDLERFKFIAQFVWLNVRGKRHHIHYPIFLKEMFTPHSDILQELFGLTANQFVEEFTKIWHNHIFGLGDTIIALKDFRADLLTKLKEKLSNKEGPFSQKTLLEVSNQIIRENNWEERSNNIYGRLEMDLYDLKKITNLPQELLDRLTWEQGEEKEFLAQGEYRGWPTKVQPVFKRPFIKLNGRYYCFDLYSLFDNLYRVMQKIISEMRPDYDQEWNSKQKELSELLPLEYIQKILPGAVIKNSVYYPNPDIKKKYTEVDGLVIYDDHLFIIECKAGKFTPTSPTTDFVAHQGSLQGLAGKPGIQGTRFLRYLKSADVVELLDEKHKKRGELRYADFRHISICAVTLEQFTEFAAQSQHLVKMGVDIGGHPVWVLSLDDLRAYADIFDNPLIFLHFVEQRISAIQSDILEIDDELDHLGLYLDHNQYSTYAKGMQIDPKTKISFGGYRLKIDRFFNERLGDPEVLCELKQDMPSQMLEIIQFLAKSNKRGRAQIASWFLNFSGDYRRLISSYINDELISQPKVKKSTSYSTHSDINFTMFVWTSSVERDKEGAIAYAQTASLINNDENRLLIELSYDEMNVLCDVSWQDINLDEIPQAILPHLRRNAEALQRQRVLESKMEKRKIGRNDPCPCGKGKKYKRCCLHA